jgi:hypothetical protein
MKILQLFSFLFVFPLFFFGQTKEKSLFWEVSGNGLTTSSYLYGTMHVQDERVFDFKEGVLEALEASTTFAMELNMDSVNQMNVMNLMWMKDDISIKDLLSKKQYSFLDNYFKDSIGQPIFIFNRMLPIMTTQMIFASDMGNQKEEALDLYFAKIAKEQDKRLVGLESMEEQIGALDGIPYKYQAKMLYEAVLDKSNGVKDTSIDELFDAYISGDLELMLKLTNDENEDEKIKILFEELMIVNRNKTMVERALPLITTDKTFIAVGAAHLGGERGVIQLLRNQGYTVVAK